MMARSLAVPREGGVIDGCHLLSTNNNGNEFCSVGKRGCLVFVHPTLLKPCLY